MLSRKEKAYKAYTDAVLRMNKHRLVCKVCIKAGKVNPLCKTYVSLYTLANEYLKKWCNLR